MPVPLTDPTPLLELARERPLLFCTDIDGTISAIGPTPEGATVSPAMRRTLQRLRQVVDVLAFVTGRRPTDGRRLVGVDGPNVVYIGNHGLARLVGGREEREPGVRRYARLVRRTVRELAALSTLPGLLLEERGPILTLHYRLAPDPTAAREAILAAVQAAPSARQLQVREGRRIVELQPPLGMTKGQAVARLVAEGPAASAVYFGDDLTDTTAFQALRELAQSTDLRAASVAVASAEASLQVLEAADYVVDGVEALQALLDRFLTALSPQERSGPPAGAGTST